MCTATVTLRSVAFIDSPPEPPNFWRGVGLFTLTATFLLMWLGAFTRASMAGISCPDWPLCHGFVLPPTADAAYPPAPMYTAYKVYLEFGHRVLAALVATGALVLGARAWRTRARPLAMALWFVLGLQVAMGALTVWLRNEPYTVVLHLALALCFVTVLLALRQRAIAPAARRSWIELVLVPLVLVQLLVGAWISSSHFGLACSEFPVCQGGALVPASMTVPIAWQLLHRAIALVLVIALLASFGHRLCRGELDALRRSAFALLLVLIQIGLGAANVLLRVPPWASALHLGVGAALFAVLVYPLTSAGRDRRSNRGVGGDALSVGG